MKRTALLLSALMLGGLLAAPPAHAAPAVSTAVTQVKASPAKQSGDCPTTVGFSAVVAAHGRGTVRYRWVRGDGSKGAIKSFHVSGASRVIVKDRQTFDRTTSGWQAVEILGKRALSAKARFSVTCAGAAKLWDVTNPLPAQPGRPLVSAADVDVSPPSYSGTCPTTVTFTATIQVSRTPAKVDYQWIDSAMGEGRTESVHFPAGGGNSRQVVLPLGVGSSTSGWKSIRILSPGGHDSGPAAFRVTCRTTPPTSPPPSSPPPSSPPPSSPPPSSPPPTQPPAQKPEPRIVSVTPGDYEGSCVEPIAYQATGRIALPAGPARKVTYWWILDGASWQRQTLDFPAGDQPRAQDVSATWSLDPAVSGSHTLGLMAEGGPAEPVERRFTVTCVAEPPTAKLTFRYLHTPLYKGDCTGSFGLRADGLVTTDRETEIKYRVVVDGKPGPIRTERLRPDRVQTIGDFWYSSARSSGTGRVRIEVLNQNKPVKEESYSWTCVPVDPSPGVVRISEFWPVAYYGDCVESPYVTAHGGFAASPGTEITYRWVIDGTPTTAHTVTVEGGGRAWVQAFYWHRHSKTSGTVRLEVMNHNKPSTEGVYPVTCQS